MQEPYKSCWECEVCETLEEHLCVCIPFDDSVEVNSAIIAMKLFKKQEAEKNV